MAAFVFFCVFTSPSAGDPVSSNHRCKQRFITWPGQQHHSDSGVPQAGGQQCGSAYDGCSDSTMAQGLAPLAHSQKENACVGGPSCVGCVCSPCLGSANIISLTGWLLFTVYPGL